MSQLKCQHCDNEAACVGSYEGATVLTPACNRCCGHGNEDGRCWPLARESESTDSDIRLNGLLATLRYYDYVTNGTSPPVYIGSGDRCLPIAQVVTALHYPSDTADVQQGELAIVIAVDDGVLAAKDSLVAEVARILTDAGFPCPDSDIVGPVRVALNNNAALAHQLKEAQRSAEYWRTEAHRLTDELAAMTATAMTAQADREQWRSRVAVAKHPNDPAADLEALRAELAPGKPVEDPDDYQVTTSLGDDQ